MDNQLLLDLHKKIDAMMGKQPSASMTSEEEAIRERFLAGLEKRKFRALIKKNLKNEL